MEHVTIKEVLGGWLISPENGYLLKNKKTKKLYKEVVIDNINKVTEFVAVKL